MSALIRLIAAVAYLAVSTAFFRPALQLLPSSGMRYRSPGLLTLLATSIGVGFARHCGLAGALPFAVATSQCIFLCLLVFLAGTRTHVVAFWLAAWIGVDLFVIALSLAGVDISGSTFQVVTFIWESVAAVFAVTTYSLRHSHRA